MSRVILVCLCLCFLRVASVQKGPRPGARRETAASAQAAEAARARTAAAGGTSFEQAIAAGEAQDIALEVEDAASTADANLALDLEGMTDKAEPEGTSSGNET